MCRFGLSCVIVKELAKIGLILLKGMIVNLANQCKVVKSKSREIGLLRICNKDKQSMKFIRNKLQRLARQLIS